MTFKSTSPETGGYDTYQLLATARDSRGAVVAQARVVTTFGHARRDGLRVLFENSCLGRTELCGAGLTCSGGACVSAEFDPNVKRPSATMHDTEGVSGEPPPKAPMPSDSGIAQEGSACSDEGEKRCAGFGSAQSLACEGGVWARQPECTQVQRCDTSESPTRGTCRAIARECMGQQPNVAFCDDEQMKACNADLLASNVHPCSDNERCSPDARGAHCACRPGFVGEAGSGEGCHPSTDCEANGGCDPQTTCSSVAGGRKCSDCPTGWNGTGESGCVPALLGLTVANAELTPVFSTGTASYRVKVPFLTQHVALTAVAPEGSQIAFNGTPARSREPWMSPVLTLGDNEIDVTAASEIGMSRMYRVVVERTGTEEAFLKASNAAANQLFGECLSISGDTLVACAPFEDSAAKGVNSDPAIGTATDSGAAYVYVRQGDKWTQQAYLKPDNTTASDFFGTWAVIEGDRLAIGAPRQNTSQLPRQGGKPGTVFIFTRKAGVWTQQAEFGATDADSQAAFGTALALSGDTLVITAPFAGLTVGTGAAYVFTRSGTTWTQQQRLAAREPHQLSVFGSSVAISGDTMVIGAQEDRDTAYRGGSVYVFTKTANGWTEQQRLVPDPPVAEALFGFSVDLRGDLLVAGLPQLFDDSRTDRMDAPQGDVRVFERTGAEGRWTQTAVLKNPLNVMHDTFGYSTRIGNGFIAVGAADEDGSSRGLAGDPTQRKSPSAGAAYLFARTPEGWKLSTYLKSSNHTAGDRFGTAIGISDDLIAVGAFAEASSGKGIDPGTDDEANTLGGAVYIFR